MSVTLNDVVGFVTSIIMVIGSLIVHEYAHVLAAKYLGAKVEKISPMPLGFSAKLKKVETLRLWERYVVYGAGAAANGMIAIIAMTNHHLSYIGILWLERLAFYNLVLCIFNLLPVFPLDGGQLAQQFLGNRMGIIRANRLILKVGHRVSWLIIALGCIQIVLFPYNFTLLLAGFYIKQRSKNITPQMQLAFFQALQAKDIQERARTMPVRTLFVLPDTALQYILERLTTDYLIMIYIDEVRMFSERALVSHIFTYGLSGTAEDVYNGQKSAPQKLGIS